MQQIRPAFSSLALALLFVIVQFGFTQTYWNDKTSTAVSLVESMAAHDTFTARELPCFTDAGLGTRPSWAEEPPLFHVVAVGLKKLGLDPWYARLWPLLCALLLAAGLVRLARTASGRPASPLLKAAAFTVPFLYVHAVRFLPDVLMAALVPFFLLALLKKRWALAALLAYLAVTTKATAIFVVGAAWLAYSLSIAGRPWRVKNLALGALLASAALPMLAWLFYLEQNAIENPFFLGALSIGRHAGGSDFGILFTGKYWGRFFTWIITHGVSVPLAILFLASLARWRERDSAERFLLLTGLGVLPYWIVVRGTQYSGPNYSFPFLVPIAAAALAAFARLERRWLRFGVLALLLASSVPKLTYTTDPAASFAFPLSDRPIQLSCKPMGAP